MVGKRGGRENKSLLLSFHLAIEVVCVEKNMFYDIPIKSIQFLLKPLYTDVNKTNMKNAFIIIVSDIFTTPYWDVNPTNVRCRGSTKRLRSRRSATKL